MKWLGGVIFAFGAIFMASVFEVYTSIGGHLVNDEGRIVLGVFAILSLLLMAIGLYLFITRKSNMKCSVCGATTNIIRGAGLPPLCTNCFDTQEARDSLQDTDDQSSQFDNSVTKHEDDDQSYSPPTKNTLQGTAGQSSQFDNSATKREMEWENYGRFFGRFCGSCMGKLGIIIFAFGTISLFLSLGMSTSIGGGVHNIGLLNLQSNLVIVSLFVVSIGFCLIVTLWWKLQKNNISKHNITDHRKQPEVGGHGEPQTVEPRDRLQNNYHSLNNQNKIYNGGTGYKKCKFCAEDIKKEAIKCRFCGEYVVAEQSDLSDKTRTEMSTINDEHSLDERISCRDGTCVGTVGKNGKCRVCGLSNE